MQNVVLTIHLILALLLTGAVLLQRSEGGGLGMGGGGGGSGVMSGRQTANIMTRLTWIFGIGLFVTSIALTVIAAREASNSSIIDQFGGNAPVSQEGTTTLPGLGTYTPPPTTSGQPVTPPAPAADASAATEPAATEPAATAPAADAPAPAPVQPVTPPAAEAPAAEPPATEAPATEAPATETPAADVPAAETPAESAAPATN